jgi:hypothetical protein
MRMMINLSLSGVKDEEQLGTPRTRKNMKNGKKGNMRTADKKRWTI